MESRRGFTTFELLIATALLLVVIGSVLTVVAAAPDYFAARNEATDQHQRLRVAADTLFADLLAADAVRPYRSSGSSPDPPGTFKADTITALGPGVKTYWLKTDNRSSTYQLMSYAGGVSFDVPVVDNVVSLSFSYEGDPEPPRMIRPLDDPAGPWTTYGPAPPLVATGVYGPRENCVFTDNGTNLPGPRLPALPAIAPAALVALSPELFTDGPWCPDDAAAERWDADLLRVRSIIVAIRVQAALLSLRGPAGDLFVHGGSAKAATRWAPDVGVRVRVSPRNMSHGA
jgi:type II secretory pathway pseudopilin PulG